METYIIKRHAEVELHERQAAERRRQFGGAGEPRRLRRAIARAFRIVTVAMEAGWQEARREPVARLRDAADGYR
jgi:hypothetical protein